MVGIFQKPPCTIAIPLPALSVWQPPCGDPLWPGNIINKELRMSQGRCTDIMLVLIHLVADHVLGGRGAGAQAGVGIFCNLWTRRQYW